MEQVLIKVAIEASSLGEGLRASPTHLRITKRHLLHSNYVSLPCQPATMLAPASASAAISAVLMMIDMHELPSAGCLGSRLASNRFCYSFIKAVRRQKGKACCT